MLPPLRLWPTAAMAVPDNPQSALAAFLLAPASGWINGQTIALDGGDRLANGAYFKQYLAWGDAEWAEARERIKARNAADKAQRNGE